MKRRIVPTLQYNIRTHSDYKNITDNPVTKKYVYNVLLEAIRHALDKNKSEVELFKIHNSNICLSIHKKDWKHTLNKAIEFYSDQENYEKCQEYKTLMNNL